MCVEKNCSATLSLQNFHLKAHKAASLFFASLLVFFLIACSRAPHSPVAQDGRLDLKTWDFNQYPTARLDGQWAVYYHQLLSPTDLDRPNAPEPDGAMAIPGFWPGDQTQGYVTCRLRLRLNTGHPALALRLGDVNSAYRLWINGKPAAAMGTVGTSRQSEIPEIAARIIQIDTTGSEIDLVLQISNFYMGTDGGVADTIIIGREADIRSQTRKASGSALIVSGCLLVMGLYHLLLYHIRPQDRSTLYFGLFCLDLGIWYLASNSAEYFLLDFLPMLNMQSLSRIDFITYYLSVPMAMMFFHTNFPRESINFMLRLFQTTAGVFSLVVLFTPIHIYLHTLTVYMPISLVAVGYALIIFTKAVYNKREGSAWFLAGITVFALTVVNDCLYAKRWVQTGYILPLGVLALIISHAFVLASRFFKAFSTVETLSRDLTEKNVALTRMDRVKDEFLANTSHELRTPLNGIIGLTESLIDGVAGKLPRKAHHNLSLVAAGARRLTHLINDILDISKMKHSDIRIKQAPVDIRAAVDTVLALTAQLVQGRPLELTSRIPDHIGCVIGDEDRIQQILFNLTGNAVKFTDQGEVIVSAAKNHDMMEIAVSDTGPGIPEEMHERIFESFEQADASETRHHGGTGLGLAITRHLVELHGGTISVDSTPGHGATFRLTLPVCTRAQAMPPSPPVAATAIVQPSFRPDAHTLRKPDTSSHDQTCPHILVVDDDPVNLQVAGDHLSLEDMSIQTATNGARALDLLNQAPLPDLILLDLMMPGMSGYEVCEKIRARHSAARLPVILLTARNRVADLVRGFDAGANDYLVKPYTRDELIARVNTHLKIKQAYVTMQENLRLKKQIKQREQTVRDLRMIQRRLAGLLNSVDDAILAVNESGEICFCNAIFEKRIGLGAEQMLGKPVEQFFNHDAMTRMQPWLDQMVHGRNASSDPAALIELTVPDQQGRPNHCRVMPALLHLDEEQLLVLIMTDKARQPDGALPLKGARHIIDTLNRNRERVQSLETTLNGLTPVILAHKPDFLDDLHSLDSAMAQVGRDLMDTGTLADKRELAVELVNLSLRCWCSATGATKGDFAAASGLWAVYVNHHGNQRTQTLDKYMHIDTLPARPRWRQVARSAEFVLESIDLTPSRKEQLEALLVRFTNL